MAGGHAIGILIETERIESSLPSDICTLYETLPDDALSLVAPV